MKEKRLNTLGWLKEADRLRALYVKIKKAN
jgi:hypothetical protein